MLHKAVAFLLIVSWIVFSGVDMLEDLRLPTDFKVYTAERSDLRGFGPVTKVANNTLENGSRILIGEIGLVIPPATANAAFQPCGKEVKTPKNNLRIYKLHRAFLI